MEEMACVFPTQGPLSQPTPVTIFTLSWSDSLARAAFAFVYAAVQSKVWARAGDVNDNPKVAARHRFRSMAEIVSAGR